jgi:hypothetical protein
MFVQIAKNLKSARALLTLVQKVRSSFLYTMDYKNAFLAWRSDPQRAACTQSLCLWNFNMLAYGTLGYACNQVLARHVISD